MIPGLKKRVVNFSDIMMYVAIALKHGRLITLLFCFSLLLGLTYYVYAKPVYYSRALIHYKSINLPVDSETVFKDSVTLLQQFPAPHIIERTAKRMGMDDIYRDIMAHHLRRIQANFNSLGDLEVEVWAYEAPLVRDWANVMLEEYLKFRAEQRAKYREDKIQSFTAEMKNISQKVDEMLRSRSYFQETNAITQTFIELNELVDVPVRIVQLSHRLEQRDQVRKKLRSDGLDVIEKLSLLASVKDENRMQVGNLVSEFAPATIGRAPIQSKAVGMPGSQKEVVVVPAMISSETKGSESWQSLDRDRRRLLDAVKEANKVYLPAHPKLAGLHKKLAEVEKAISMEYEAALNEFNLEYTMLADARRELEKKLPAYNAAKQRYERLQQNTGEFEAGQLAWGQMYNELAKVIATYDFGANKERTQLKYVGMVEIRDVLPVSPNRLKLVLIALILGASLAVGVPFMFEYLDYTVTDVGEMEDTLQMRGLGIVPKISDGPVEKFPVLTLIDRSARHLVENFRVIRTNLLLNDAKSLGDGKSHASQVIMVASAVPKEGKTAISANLAISFAQKGERTLLIDCDLRRGRMHRVFGCSTAPGLSNVMIENVGVTDACRPTSQENLWILTCGKHIGGATELLGTPVFTSLLDELRSRYDRIVIDTPPVLGLSETSMMQKVVDGVVFVISSSQTPLRSVKAAVGLLQANGANFYGFVLNRIDLSSSPNYYNYYYYSYHYYDKYQALERV